MDFKVMMIIIVILMEDIIYMIENLLCRIKASYLLLLSKVDFNKNS